MPSVSFAGFPFSGASFAARIIQGSSIDPLCFLLVSSTDHTSPVLGVSPTVLISQNAGAFAAPMGVVTELGQGWYCVQPNASDVSVAGPLLLNATAAGADVASKRFEVVTAYGVPPLTLNQANYPLTFLLVLSSDHLASAVGLTPTVLIGKVGQLFATPVGAVAEVGGSGQGLGWYYVTGNALDTNVPGPLIVHAYGAGTDFTDQEFDVANPPPLPSGTYNDLMAAVVAQLRSSGPLIAALAENVNVAGATKIWADDLAMGQPSPPWLAYSEPRGNKEYQFGGTYVERGSFAISVLGTGKQSVRGIADLVIDALNDETGLTFLGGHFTYLREDVNAAQDISSIGPGSPVMYKRVITMKYVLSGPTP